MLLRFFLLFLMPPLLYACDDNEQNQELDTQLVRPAKIATAHANITDQNKTFPGITEAAKRTDLAFRVNGQIINLTVRAGQDLKQGDLIAELDTAKYQNTFNDRRAKYELARTKYQRQQTLFKQKHIAESRLDEARSNFQAAEAAYKLAQDNLNYTKLRAPYNGLISRIDVDAFQNVQAKESIGVFQGTKEINIIFNVPESLFLQLNRNNTNDGHVIVHFNSLPDRAFDAWYKEHETVPDAATRSYKVTVSMPRPTDLSVFPGMSVNVTVNLSALFGRDTSGVLIPLEAVFNQGGKNWVWQLNEENTAQKVEVEVEVAGIEDNNIRILSGLMENDRVIAVGVSHVIAGQKVRPMIKERGL